MGGWGGVGGLIIDGLHWLDPERLNGVGGLKSYIVHWIMVFAFIDIV